MSPQLKSGISFLQRLVSGPIAAIAGAVLICGLLLWAITSRRQPEQELQLGPAPPVPQVEAEVSNLSFWPERHDVMIRSRLTAEDLATLESHAEVQSVQLTATSFNDDLLRVLAKLPKLQSLSLRLLPDSGVVDLHGLSQLQQLFIWGGMVDLQMVPAGGITGQMKSPGPVNGPGQSTNARIAGLEHLPNLRTLELRTPNVNSELQQVKSLMSLQELRLADANITDAGLAHLKGLTQLQTLLLSRTAVTDAGLANLKDLKNLRRLELDSTKASSAGLAFLQDLIQLETLDLSDTNVDDTGLSHLKSLTRLKKLNLLKISATSSRRRGFGQFGAPGDFGEFQAPKLSPTKITDAGLAYLKGMTELQSLSLDGANVSDAGLACLKGMTKLQSLGLADTNVTDAGLAYLKGMMQLQSLGLDDANVTDAGLAHLTNLNQLTALGLNGTRISDAGLIQLKTLSQLSYLGVDNTDVTTSGLQNLCKELPNLKKSMESEPQGPSLEIKRTFVLLGKVGGSFDTDENGVVVELDFTSKPLRDEDLAKLNGSTLLKKLVLDGTNLTDGGLAHLAGLPNLQVLSLRSTRITDDGLKHVKKLTKLQQLDLRQTKVTDRGIEELQQALPNVKIVR